MIDSLIGTKLAMTHVYDANGQWVAVTRLAMGPCVVTQEKTTEKDGYQAVQLAFGKNRRMTKPMAGHLIKSKFQGMPRFIREVKEKTEGIHVGDAITVSDVFHIGDVVNVTGWTKGRGFTGVVKRWGFSGGPKTHGQSDRHRAPGSIGQGTDPGRVHKGKKMPGHYGMEQKTIKHLKAVRVDSVNNELWVTGAVPGHRNGPVTVKLQGQAQAKEAREKGS